MGKKADWLMGRTEKQKAMKSDAVRGLADSDELRDLKAMPTADKVFFGLFALALLVGLVAGIADHWQWTLIIPIGAAVALGLVKFGWDAATAVEKKARE